MAKSVSTPVIIDDFFAEAAAEMEAVNAGLDAVSTVLSSFASTLVSGEITPLGEQTWTLPSGKSKTGVMGHTCSRITLMEFSHNRQNRANGEGLLDVAYPVFGVFDYSVGFIAEDGTLQPIPLPDAGTPMRLFYGQRMACNTEVTDALRMHLLSKNWTPRPNSATPKLGERYPDSDRICKRENVWNLQPKGNQTQRAMNGLDVGAINFTPSFNATARTGGYRSIVEAINANILDIVQRTTHIEVLVAQGTKVEDNDKALARRFANALTGAQRENNGVISTRENADRFSVSSFSSVEVIRHPKTGMVLDTDATDWVITSGDNNTASTEAVTSTSTTAVVDPSESPFK